MKIWAVANQKGGVGKTTTSVTLAGLLAQDGYDTLLVDLDPHGSLTAYFGYDPESVEPSVYALFQAGGKENTPDPAGLVHKTGVDHLHLMPATTALATLDRQLGTRGGMGLIVAQALRRLNGRYQHVLIDCPPMLGVLMVNALAACEHLLIPVQTEFLALKGLERMARTLGMVQRSRQTELPYTIVPTLFDRRTRASIDSLRMLRERYGDWVSPTVIPIDTQFREASRAGVPLPVMYPNARGVRAYRTLLDGLLGYGDVGQEVAVK